MAPSRRTNQARQLMAVRRNGKLSTAPNTTIERLTAARRDHETRFKAGNEAARRHGLRAGVRKELRRRDRRTSRLLGEYVRLRAEQGRELKATQLPLARRYVELEVLARDLYALLMSARPGAGTLTRYISVVRAQTLLGNQLGENVTRARGGNLDALQNSAIWQIAEASRQRRLLEAKANGN